MGQVGNGLFLEKYLLGRTGYLFGSRDVRHPHYLSRLIEKLESQGSVPVAEPNSDLQPLVGHPKRLLSLDQMLALNDKQLTVKDIIDESVNDQQEKLSCASGDATHAIVRQLAHSCLKRYWRFHRREDLDGAIWYNSLALSHAHEDTYHDLECLLGLCSALYDRCQLLGLDEDYQALLLYLKVQRTLDAETLLAPTLAKLLTVVASSVCLVVLTSQKWQLILLVSLPQPLAVQASELPLQSADLMSSAQSKRLLTEQEKLVPNQQAQLPINQDAKHLSSSIEMANLGDGRDSRKVIPRYFRPNRNVVRDARSTFRQVTDNEQLSPSSTISQARSEIPAQSNSVRSKLLSDIRGNPRSLDRQSSTGMTLGTIPSAGPSHRVLQSFFQSLLQPPTTHASMGSSQLSSNGKPSCQLLLEQKLR